MDLTDLIGRPPPRPWADGDNLPWDDPAFSERMLAEHLTQEHDLASRRSAIIDAQVEVLDGLLPRAASVLDLACGPGLYLRRLADRGHSGLGIDFGPASIRHAREHATPGVEYVLGDLRSTPFGGGFDAALLLYGQMNVFRRVEIEDILRRAHAALRPGGVLVLEPQAPRAVRQRADGPHEWSVVESGLFSDRPHLLLTDAAWDDESRVTTERFTVVDAATGRLAVHAIPSVAWEPEELADLLARIGFGSVDVRDSLSGDGLEGDALFAVVAEA